MYGNMVALGLHLGGVGVAWEPGAGAPYTVMHRAAGLAFLGTDGVSWMRLQHLADSIQHP